MGIEIEKLTAYFEADDSGAEVVFRRVEKRINDFEARLKKFGKLNFSESANSFREIDRSLQKATQEITRYQRQTEQGERRITASVEREARAQANVRIREQRRAANEMIRLIDRVNRQENQRRGGAPTGGSGTGSAILAGVTGGFIGGGLAATALTTINAVTELTRKSIELGAKSVQLAGDFQVTTNALAVFTGSVKSARTELESVEQLAANTPGLRLESAQVGYQQLRAMGFQAETTKRLLAGLANQKIISGVDDGAVNRVIVNLIQLSTGSHRAAQDLKEMVLSMPGLLSVFRDAFKTTDFGKIGQMFKDTPTEAIEKLTESMANSNKVAGGYNDAWGKLQDAFVSAGRKFGEPILDPLTRDLEKLNQNVSKNGEEFKKLGVTVDDFYRGFVQQILSLSQATKGMNDGSGGMLGEASQYVGFGIGGKLYLDYVRNLGAQQRKIEEARQKFFDSVQTINPNSLSQSQKTVLGGGLLGSITGKTKEQTEIEEQVMRQTDQMNQKLLTALEKAEQQRMAMLKSFFDERMSVISANQTLELAGLDTFIADTLEQEISLVNRRAAVQTKYLNQQLAETRKYYADALTDKSLSDQDRQKLELEAAQKIRSLNVQVQENELRRQREVAEKERAIQDKRRQAQIESYNLMSRQISQSYDRRIFDTERAIEQQSVSEEAGYDRLIELTRNRNEYLTEFLRGQYALRLQDKRLSAEERTNLEREANLAEQDLAEQNRRRILEIEDQKNRAIKERIQKSFDEIQKAADRQIGRIRVQQERSGIFSDLLNIRLGQQGNLEGIIDTVFLDYTTRLEDLQKRKKEIETAQANRETLTGPTYSEQIKAIDAQIKAIERGFPATQKAIAQLFKDLEGGKVGFTVFDEIIEKNYQANRALERQNLEAELEAAQRILNTASQKRDSFSPAEFYEFESAVERSKERLRNFDVATEIGNAGLETRKNLLKSIAEIEKRSPAAVAAMQYNAEIAIAQEKQSLLINTFTLEQKYYQNSELWALKRKEAILQYEREIFEAQQQTLIQSQITIDQRIRKSLAELPTYTTIYKDFIGNLPLAFGDAMGQIAQQWDGTWRGLADVAKRVFGQMLLDLAQQYLRSAFAQLIGKLIGSLLGAFGGGGAAGVSGHEGAHIPGFASGGFPEPNRISIVGENGPELFIPKVRGQILSNDDSRNLLGGGQTQVINNTVVNNTIHAPRGTVAAKSARQLTDATLQSVARGTKGG